KTSSITHRWLQMHVQDLHRPRIRRKTHDPSIEPSGIRWNINALCWTRFRKETKPASRAALRVAETHVWLIARQGRPQKLLPIRGCFLQTDDVRLFPPDDFHRRHWTGSTPVHVVRHEPKMRSPGRLR